jgi:hypothetical protein
LSARQYARSLSLSQLFKFAEPLLSVEQAQKTFRSEMERFAALVKKVGIEPQ